MPSQAKMGSRRWFKRMRDYCKNRLGYSEATTREVIANVRKILKGESVGHVF